MKNLGKKACIVTLALLAMSVVAPTQQTAKQGGKTSAGSANEEKALEARLREYADALKKKDTAALDKIWADGYTFINPRGQLLSKAQRLENVRSGATAFEDIERQREKLEVRGNTAIDIGRVTLKGTKYSGQESSGDYRYMQVWTKDKGQWRLLANQLTAIK
jgi:ketosteroid isomerase-like protein